MPSTRRPNDETVPAVERRSPAARFSSVDLPAPVGPTIATNSPGATVNETPSTATYEPPRASAKRCATSANSIALTRRVYAPPEIKSSGAAPEGKSHRWRQGRRDVYQCPVVVVIKERGPLSAVTLHQHMAPWQTSFRTDGKAVLHSTGRGARGKYVDMEVRPRNRPNGESERPVRRATSSADQ